MNANQETFLREYLRTGDKLKAYQTAYPNAKQTSLKNSANRLLQNNPEIIAAVNAERAEAYEEARAEAKAKIKFEYLQLEEAKQILTLTARGTRELEKTWRTRDGFETQPVKPSHAQVLSAIHKYAMMEGWYPKGRAGGEKKEEEKPEEPYSLQIFMNKLPIDEYGSIYRNTLEAYYDPDGPTWRCQPDNNHTAHQFLPLQKKREEKRDAEREARMTPQLKLEEEQALREFENRRADEDGYHHHEKLIDELLDEYSKAPEPAKLETLTRIQNMCGLRFLHHRHRYEAEREAGWQFHPFNHALIKKSCHSKNQGCHSEHSEESARPMQLAESIESGKSANQPNLRFRQENRQQTTTTERSELMSMPIKNNDAMRITTDEPMQPTQPEPPKEKPTHLQLLKQGYTPINELLQDEYDYYLKNQGSTTWKQLNDLRKFSSHRNAPPETKAQIEQETHWLYHPDNPHYAKRQPGYPLVRTKFPGPMRNV